jgi:hypothetical protein
MRDDLDDYRIQWRLDDSPCEVYVFGRWGTYNHPVLPLDPLTHAEVLTSPSVCRAFVRDLGGEPLMVRFACYRADTRSFTLDAPCEPGAYAVETADGTDRIGVHLTPPEAAMADRLILVDPSGDTASLRELTWAYTYDYDYGPDGALRTFTGSDSEGSRTLPA